MRKIKQMIESTVCDAEGTSNVHLKRNIKIVIAVIICCLLILLTCKIIYVINSQPDSASSAVENVEIVHNIYTGESKHILMDWNKYKEETLYNLGFCTSITDKKWNGEWVVDKEFIEEYVKKYSVEEFFDIYNTYVVSYLSKTENEWGNAESGAYSTDADFIENNFSLFNSITETTNSIFELSDLFKVVNCNPEVDVATSVSSKVLDESGFSEKIMETYEYDVYRVKYFHYYEIERYIALHSRIYDVSSWELENKSDNSRVKDIEKKEYISDYTEFDNHRENWVSDGKAEAGFSNLKCRWVVVGDETYYERSILGLDRTRYKYGLEALKKSWTTNFSREIKVLTTDANESREEYIDY
jgi:hypothetical protein